MKRFRTLFFLDATCEWRPFFKTASFTIVSLSLAMKVSAQSHRKKISLTANDQWYFTGSCALLAYDHCLTFDREVDEIWWGRKTPSVSTHNYLTFHQWSTATSFLSLFNCEFLRFQRLYTPMNDCQEPILPNGLLHRHSFRYATRLFQVVMITTKYYPRSLFFPAVDIWSTHNISAFLFNSLILCSTDVSTTFHPSQTVSVVLMSIYSIGSAATASR